METKANYLMIGGFVLGALAFAFIFIFWITNFAGGGKRYLIVFEGSVSGLTSGSSVSFNGIKIGEVQTFALDPTDGRKVQVVVGVHDDTPVRENSRAKIQSLGLTGGKVWTRRGNVRTSHDERELANDAHWSRRREALARQLQRLVSR